MFRGIDYAAGSSPPGKPCLQRVHALRIDTRARSLRFYTTPRCPGWSAGGDETRRRTTRAFLAANHLSVAVNADFYSDSPGAGMANLIGLAISDGQIVSRPSGTPSLLITRDNHARIAITKRGVDLTGIWTAVSGLGWILAHGVVRETWPERHARTGVGLSRHGRYLYLVAIDGDQPGVSDGATTGELAVWMKRFGAWQAMNLDGGGSTTMAAADGRGWAMLLNVPVGWLKRPNSERQVGNNFGAYAPPLDARPSR